MPLLDHFHGATEIQYPWPTIAQAWVVSLMGWLNRRLQEEGYRAYVDVFVESGVSHTIRDGNLRGYPLLVPAVFPDRFEVLVYDPSEVLRPVGVITLATAKVKCDPDQRAAFVRCCVAHLHRGAGVVLIDVVSAGSTNLHNDILDLIAPRETARLDATRTSVASYSPVNGTGSVINAINIWPHPALIGQPLPTVPFVLSDRRVLFLELDAIYTAAIEATGL